MPSATESPPAVPKILLSKNEAAEALGLSLGALERLTAPRGPIEAKRIGRRCLYRPADLQKFANGTEASGR